MIVSPNIPDNLRWFDNARYGLFIHFGMYSLLGNGEWVMYKQNIPLADYAPLQKKFNPDKFNADEWIDFAQSVGCKYIIFTTKHHDGFCMFDSALTDYKITNTPFGRDFTGELIDACHRHNFPIILYYSQPDWSHKNYVNRPGAFKDLSYTPVGQEPDWEKYIQYMFGQVEELCTKYGKIDGIFFDGSHKTKEEWHGDELYEMIHRYQPDAVVNDRARHGDYYTPERAIIENIDTSLGGKYLLEICNCVMRSAWGYKDTDDMNTPTKLASDMLKAARLPCNLALNAGPAPDGTIPDTQKAVFYALGEWLKTSGEGYYATRPVSLGMAQNFVTLTKGNSLYVHMLAWHESTKLSVPRITETPVRVRLLSTGKELPFEAVDGNTVTVTLPLLPPTVMPECVALDFDCPAENAVDTVPKAPAPVPNVLAYDVKDGAVLTPATAIYEGYGVKGCVLKTQGEWIGGFMTPDQSAVWKVDVPAEVMTTVTVAVKTPNDSYGECIPALQVDGENGVTLTADVPDKTGKYILPMGTLRLTAGVHEFRFYAKQLKFGYMFPAVGEIRVK